MDNCIGKHCKGSAVTRVRSAAGKPQGVHRIKSAPVAVDFVRVKPVINLRQNLHHFGVGFSAWILFCGPAAGQTHERTLKEPQRLLITAAPFVLRISGGPGSQTVACLRSLLWLKPL